MSRLLARFLILAAAFATGGAVRADPAEMRKVPVDPPSIERPGNGGILKLFTRKSRRACIDVRGIAGAIVTDERTIEIRMVTGERWRMGFKQDCPALSYYQGFYYRRTQAGKMCAGRDTIIARSGSECRVHSLSRIAPNRRD